MRNISTGLGLAILGGCILGATALSSSSPHHAANASVSLDRARQVDRRIQSGSGWNSPPCSVQIEHWFSPTCHSLQECSPLQSFFFDYPETNKDLLGDGRPRAITPSTLNICATCGDQGYLSVLEFQPLPDGSTAQVVKSILSSADAELLANLFEMGPFWSMDQRFGAGLADMDGDGDLDLVLAGTGRVWLENIAGDAVRRGRFDLDRDGHVNTADLSLLLMEFTD